MNRVGDVDPRSILVALDDSPDAAEALEQAIAIRLANALLVRPDGIQAGSWSQGGDAQAALRSSVTDVAVLADTSPRDADVA